MAEICGAIYDRLTDNDVRHIPCNYLQNHKSEHSWYSLRQQDLVEREAQESARRASQEALRAATEPPLRLAPATTFGGDPSREISVVLNSMLSGRYDPYLEAILSIGHERKRVLRGVTDPHALMNQGGEPS